MAVTKILKIDVKDNEVEELEGKLKGIKSQMSQVEGETKKTDGAFKKLGENSGAIAILDSLTGGLATRIRDGAEATKLFNISLKGTKTALIATGIGAFAVALGAIVAYWDDIVDIVQGVNGRLERQIKLLERKNELLENELGILELQEELLGLQGKSTEEIRKKKIELLKAQIEINGAELVALELQKERIIRQKEELNFFDKALAGTVSVAQATANLLFGNKDTIISAVYGDVETLNETEDKINDISKAILKAQIQLESLREGSSKKEDDEPTRGPDQSEAEVIGASAVEILETEGLRRVDLTRSLENEITKLERAAAAERMEIAELEAQSKIDSFELFADNLGRLQNVVGEHTAVGKALAVASIIREQVSAVSQIISATAAANAKAVLASPITSGQPWVGLNTASAAVGIGASVAGAAQAISQLGGGGGGGSQSSLPDFGARGQSVAPTFNVIDNSPENQIIQAINNLKDTPIRTFVVDKDVTSAQELTRNKIEASSFG
ncbi:MAG: hypothetical protein AAF717_22695 [Bacteroidota bacterium]